MFSYVTQIHKLKYLQQNNKIKVCSSFNIYCTGVKFHIDFFNNYGTDNKK